MLESQPSWTPAALPEAIRAEAIRAEAIRVDLEAQGVDAGRLREPTGEEPGPVLARLTRELLVQLEGAADDDSQAPATQADPQAALRALQARALAMLGVAESGGAAPVGEVTEADVGQEPAGRAWLLARLRALLQLARTANPAPALLREHLEWLRGPSGEAIPAKERLGLLATLELVLRRREQDASSAAADKPARARRRDEQGASTVDDAGLVLLWPFLERLFQRTGLVHPSGTGARGFVDPFARTRAVYLLHALACEELAAPEFALILPKVLCGLEPEDSLEPLEPQGLDPELQGLVEEGERMLAAVIAHAEVLGKISPAGLRSSFLRRRGLLRSRDGAWLLQVEAETHDILLSRLPWSWEWLTLPWMRAPLRVEW
ncbi:MAG: hypothetical protein KC457_32365, partial [Myxococcales bacterium]|nr:hypothetical protein [Myxococcales bacterium]